MAQQNIKNSVFKIKTTLPKSAIVLLLCIFAVLSDHEYIGCFIDGRTRALDDVMIGRSYTPEKCAQACSRFRFFSIQSDDECFCDSSYADAIRYGEDPHGCPNGKGGGWRNALYAKGDSGSETYLGCSQIYHSGLPILIGFGYNVETCRKACANYKYFAIWNPGDFCYCDNQFNDATSSFCPNVADLSFPGFFYMYRQKVATAYIGCFIDQYGARALNDRVLGYGYTVETCADACFGYSFYSIQYNDECFCENSFEDAIRYGEDPDGCSNGKGGAWRNALYVNQASPDECGACSFDDYRLSNVIDPCAYENKISAGALGAEFALGIAGLVVQQMSPILSTAISWVQLVYGVSNTDDDDQAKHEWETLMTCIDDKINNNNLKLVYSNFGNIIDKYRDTVVAAQRDLSLTHNISEDTKEDMESWFENMDDNIGDFVSMIDTYDQKRKALEAFSLLVQYYQLLAATHLSFFEYAIGETNNYVAYTTDFCDYQENIVKLYDWIDAYYENISDEYEVSLAASSCKSTTISYHGYGMTQLSDIELKRASDASTITKCGAFGGSGYLYDLKGTKVGIDCGDCNTIEQTINRWDEDFHVFEDNFLDKYYNMIYDIKETAEMHLNSIGYVCP